MTRENFIFLFTLIPFLSYVIFIFALFREGEIAMSLKDKILIVCSILLFAAFFTWVFLTKGGRSGGGFFVNRERTVDSELLGETSREGMDSRRSEIEPEEKKSSLIATPSPLPDLPVSRLPEKSPSPLSRDEAVPTGIKPTPTPAGKGQSQTSSSTGDQSSESVDTTHLAGRVTNQNGDPVAEVSIKAQSGKKNMPSRGSAITDSGGNYFIEGLRDIPHIVELVHPDYDTRMERNVAVGRDDANFVLVQEMEATLKGLVVDSRSGEPLERFTVRVEGDPLILIDPKEKGRFFVKKLRRGRSYRVTIEAPRFGAVRDELVQMPSERGSVEKIFRLGAAGSIRGRVMGKITRRPLYGVEVRLNGSPPGGEAGGALPDAVVKTVEDGRFEFPDAPAGDNTLYFVPPKPFAPISMQVEVEQGGATEIGDVEFEGGAILRGRLVQMPGEIPVPGESVNLTAHQFHTTTDTDGAFEFGGLKFGPYIIGISRYEIVQMVILSQLESEEYIIRIGAGILKGRVLQGASPLPARIGLRQTDPGEWKYADTNSSGDFEIGDLIPGRWLVKVTSREYGYQSFEEWIDIAPDQVTERDFVFPAGWITGAVLDSEEKPVAGAQISVRRSIPANEEDEINPATWYAVSKPDGSFMVENLFPDVYGVTASKKDLGMDLVENVIVPENAPSRPVTLYLGSDAGGSLVSLALDLDGGKPLPEAWCRLTTAAGTRFHHGQTRDSDGILRIENIPSGGYLVEVSSEGYSVKTHQLEILEGKTVELADVIYRTGDLRLTVRDAGGVPVAGVSCHLEPVSPNSIEEPRSGKTDLNGLWIQRGLFPEQYRIIAVYNELTVKETVSIRKGEVFQKEVIVK